MLTDWIVSAAEQCGLPVQSTSIPGVAQRTGATTYYVEIFPVPLADLGGKRPVLALSPGVGDVDVVVASELLEAGRAISNGFVTADRTLLISSTSRVYLTVEKMQMADGRYDSERLIKAVGQNAKAASAVRHGGGGQDRWRHRQFGDARRDRGKRALADSRPKRSRRRSSRTARRSRAICAVSVPVSLRRRRVRRPYSPAPANAPPSRRSKISKPKHPRCPNRRAPSRSKACAASSPIRTQITRGFISTG